MDFIIRDAHKVNPGIKIAMTLVWGDGDVIANIFSNTKVTPQQNADAFAANLVAYLRYYKIDGFDIDWESPLSDETTEDQFKLLIDAVGAAFKKQSDKHFYLTLSPAEVGNLDAAAVNNNVDFRESATLLGFHLPEHVHPGRRECEAVRLRGEIRIRLPDRAAGLSGQQGELPIPHLHRVAAEFR
jgi:hypothetical protein